MSKNIVINSEPISGKHICFLSKTRGDKIDLYEIVEYTYNHPDSQGYSIIVKIEIELRKRYDKIEKNASGAILLEANQNACDIIYDEFSIENYS